jgi:hypothetical protein
MVCFRIDSPIGPRRTISCHVCVEPIAAAGEPEAQLLRHFGSRGRSCCDMLAEDRTQSRRCRSSSHRVGRSSDRSGGCAGVPKSTWHHVHEWSEARKGCGGCAPLTLTPLCCYWDQPRTRWLPHVGIVAGRPNDSSVLSVRATSLGGRYVLNPAGREVRPDCHHCATRLGSPARAVRRYVPHPRF